MEFCQWFLSQPEDFPQNVPWSDEKWFVVYQAPNAKNDVTWVPWNTHEEVKCKAGGRGRCSDHSDGDAALSSSECAQTRPGVSGGV